MCTTPVKLNPTIVGDRECGDGVHMEYLLEAVYKSPGSGKTRSLRSTYKWPRSGDNPAWRSLPRAHRSKISRNCTMQRKRAFQVFDTCGHEIAKQAERDRWARRQQIKQAAGYPSWDRLDLEVRRAMDVAKGDANKALRRLKAIGMIAAGSPQDSVRYVRQRLQGLQRSEAIASAWEVEQLLLVGL